MTCSFTEEGELVEDLSDDLLIHGAMQQGTTVVFKRKLYAVGWRIVAVKYQMEVFSGKMWLFF